MEWTATDAKRAAREGWKRVGDFVAQAYDSDGCCPFPHAIDIVEFLRNRGKKSEWHKAVYLSLPWTDADDLMTVSEGWRLTFHSIITRSLVFFATNDAARDFVVTRAHAGDPLHIKALSTLAKTRLIYGD